MGINFISGDTDNDKAGPEKEKREGECMISFVRGNKGGYWKSPDHFRAGELETGELGTTNTVDGETAVAPVGIAND